LAIAPVWLVLWPAIGRHAVEPVAVTDLSARRFLWTATWGPGLACALASAAVNVQIRGMWASSFWPLVGLWLLASRPLDAAAWPRVRRRLLLLVVFLLTLELAHRWVWPRIHQPPERILYPGAAIARQVDDLWRSRSGGQPLPLLVGNWWPAGCVSFYLPDHPRVIGDADPDPDLGPADIAALLSVRGGLVVWDADQLGPQMPVDLAALYPMARPAGVVSAPWPTGVPAPPVHVGVALVLPGGEQP